jgi:hypothetical protein
VIFFNEFRKFLGNSQVWFISFHPEHIGVFQIFFSSSGTEINGVVFNWIESFFSSWGFPIEVELESVIGSIFLSLF